jgi:hypothetical protein
MTRIITIEIDQKTGDIAVDVEGYGYGRDALRVQEAFAVALEDSPTKNSKTSIGTLSNRKVPNTSGHSTLTPKD